MSNPEMSQPEKAVKGFLYVVVFLFALIVITPGGSDAFANPFRESCHTRKVLATCDPVEYPNGKPTVTYPAEINTQATQPLVAAPSQDGFNPNGEQDPVEEPAPVPAPVDEVFNETPEAE